MRKLIQKPNYQQKLWRFKQGGLIRKYQNAGIIDTPAYEWDFGTAFLKARWNKDKSFQWNGNTYNTGIDYGDNPSFYSLTGPQTPIQKTPEEDPYTTLRYNYMQAVENPTLEGYNAEKKIWTRPTRKGFDRKQIGIGLDTETNVAVRKFLEDNGRTNSPWLTDEEMKSLQAQKFDELENILTKHTKGVKLSDIKRAIAIGLLYHGHGPKLWKPNGPKTRRLNTALFKGTDDDLINAVSDFYNGLNTERYKNHSEFWNNYKR